MEPSPLAWYLSPWKRPFRYDGRSGRSEFWWFTIGHLLALGVLVMALIAFYPDQSGSDRMAFGMVATTCLVYYLAALNPSISVGIRRLHDIGYSGWWLLASLIPPAWAVLLFLYLRPSQPGPNRYGETPLPPA